ncbi:hypothetical protein Tco_0558086, partial [Tanacetum coccineum]
GRGDDGEMMRMKMVAVGGLCEGGDDIDSGVVEMEGVVWWRRGGGEGEGGVDVLVIVGRGDDGEMMRMTMVAVGGGATAVMILMVVSGAVTRVAAGGGGDEMRVGASGVDEWLDREARDLFGVCRITRRKIIPVAANGGRRLQGGRLVVAGYLEREKCR